MAGKPFTPGPDPRRGDSRKVGKLGGRPPKEYKAKLRHHEPEAVETLVRVMKTARRKADRIAAAKELLDRSRGRPITPIAQAVTKAETLRIVVTYEDRPSPKTLHEQRIVRDALDVLALPVGDGEEGH